MIRRYIARIAARYMNRHRVLSEREKVHAKARQLCAECDIPVPRVLR